MRRHGWSAQVPVRQAMERDDEAVIVWKDQVWPDIKASSSGGWSRRRKLPGVPAAAG
jgi:hypothetical protein